MSFRPPGDQDGGDQDGDGVDNRRDFCHGDRYRPITERSMTSNQEALRSAADAITGRDILPFEHGAAMSLATATVASPLRTDESGVIRIGSSRVMLERVVHAFDAGASAEEIVASYPTLDLGDVYATIAFILKNRAEVDAYLAESEAEAERSHRKWEAKYPTADLRRRIRERAAARA